MPFTLNHNGIPCKGVYVELNLWKDDEIINRFGSAKRDKRKAKMKEWTTKIKRLQGNKANYYITIQIEH
jgi:ribulose 1,5-bisphosphate carboxylase large subunit-like protein